MKRHIFNDDDPVLRTVIDYELTSHGVDILLINGNLPSFYTSNYLSTTLARLEYELAEPYGGFSDDT